MDVSEVVEGPGKVIRMGGGGSSGSGVSESPLHQLGGGDDSGGSRGISGRRLRATSSEGGKPSVQQENRRKVGVNPRD